MGDTFADEFPLKEEHMREMPSASHDHRTYAFFQKVGTRERGDTLEGGLAHYICKMYGGDPVETIVSNSNFKAGHLWHPEDEESVRGLRSSANASAAASVLAPTTSVNFLYRN